MPASPFKTPHKPMPVPDHPMFARLRSLAVDGPIVVAHRGDSSHFAENTLEAFRAASPFSPSE